MHNLRAVFSWLFILLVIAVVGLYVFVTRNGEEIARQRLSALLRRPVTVGQVRFIFPFGVRLDDLSVEGAFAVKTVRVQLELPVYYDRQAVISKMRLSEPVFFVQRLPDSRISWGGPDASPPEKAGAGGQDVERSETDPEQRSRYGVLVQYFEVENGRVEFTDRRAGEGAGFQVTALSLKASAVSYPVKPVTSKFELNGELQSATIPFAGSKIDAQGQLNLGAKDMDVKVKVIDPDGRVSLTANLKSVNNDMAVDGKASFHKIGKKQGEQETSGLRSAEMVIGALQAAGLSADVNFSFKTKMDDFRIESLGLYGDVVYDGGDKKFQDNMLNIGRQLESIGKKITGEKDAAPEVPAGPK